MENLDPAGEHELVAPSKPMTDAEIEKAVLDGLKAWLNNFHGASADLIAKVKVGIGQEESTFRSPIDRERANRLLRPKSACSITALEPAPGVTVLRFHGEFDDEERHIEPLKAALREALLNKQSPKVLVNCAAVQYAKRDSILPLLFVLIQGVESAGGSLHITDATKFLPLLENTNLVRHFTVHPSEAAAIEELRRNETEKQYP